MLPPYLSANSSMLDYLLTSTRVLPRELTTLVVGS